MPLYFSYSFQSSSNEFAEWALSIPLVAPTNLSPPQLDSCSTGNPLTACDGLTLETTSFPVYDAIHFNFISIPGGTPGTTSYLFADGSFENIGTFTSIDGDATLTISPVPETATWLMLILGFGVIGTVLRRRRRIAIA